MVRIAIDHERIAEFCRRHHIRRLDLFGSVLRDDFRPDSDVDVLVEFEEGHEPGLEIDSMELELHTIFGRKVDLVRRDSVERNRNYVIRRHILRTVEPVYVA
jgi:uncharacterized protein